MSVKQDVTHAISEFTGLSVDLFAVIAELASGRTPSETPEDIMRKLIAADAKIRSSVKRCSLDLFVHDCRFFLTRL
jgi:hypothetical protein